MKLNYCVIDKGWYEMEVNTLHQAFLNITIFLKQGIRVQQFNVKLDNEGPISFIIKGDDLVLLEYKNCGCH